MEISTATLEGIVVIVVDTAMDAPRTERALSQAGATVFIAHDRQNILDVLTKVTPHFAVIDPTVVDGTSPDSAARMFFDHESCRAIVYSRDLPAASGVKLRWLIDKKEPVAAVVGAVVEAVKDPMWIRKGGEELKPIQ